MKVKTLIALNILGPTLFALTHILSETTPVPFDLIVVWGAGSAIMGFYTLSRLTKPCGVIALAVFIVACGLSLAAIRTFPLNSPLQPHRFFSQPVEQELTATAQSLIGHGYGRFVRIAGPGTFVRVIEGSTEPVSEKVLSTLDKYRLPSVSVYDEKQIVILKYYRPRLWASYTWAPNGLPTNVLSNFKSLGNGWYFSIAESSVDADTNLGLF